MVPVHTLLDFIRVFSWSICLISAYVGVGLFSLFIFGENLGLNFCIVHLGMHLLLALMIVLFRWETTAFDVRYMIICQSFVALFLSCVNFVLSAL